MKKVFFVLLALCITFSCSVVMGEQTRDLKIVKPESGTPGADFSGIWEGSLNFLGVGRGRQIQQVKSITLVVEEVSPPNIKGLFLFEGFPPQEIQGEIKDPKTLFIVLKSGGKLTLSLSSDGSIRAELVSMRPGPPDVGKLFKKK